MITQNFFKHLPILMEVENIGSTMMCVKEFNWVFYTRFERDMYTSM